MLIRLEVPQHGELEPAEGATKNRKGTILAVDTSLPSEESVAHR